jgi:hypothetical protein
MKKITLSLLGAAMLVVSCQKNEKMLATEQPEEELSAAPPRKCASQEVLEEQLRTDPQRARNLEELERKTQAFHGRSQFRYAGKLYIPVVVNVVLPNASRVSQTQINSQIEVLNEDFGKSNSELQKSNVYLAGYPLTDVANCQIEFYVSDVFYQEATGSFGTNDAVKKTGSGGLNPTDPTTKMNIWVCDLSSGLLGYAQFPGGPASTDGIVIDYQAFGTTASYSMYSQFKLGRTATHEIGHWLNLRHIWGDRRCGSDGVSDTPVHDDANGGCPGSNHRSRCTGKPLEQWMNYMDYTYDACMYMFSAGQKTRMDAAIDASRAAFVSQTK